MELLLADSYRNDLPVGHHCVAVHVLVELADQAAQICLQSFSGGTVKENDLGTRVIMLPPPEAQKQVHDELRYSALLTAHLRMFREAHLMTPCSLASSRARMILLRMCISSGMFSALASA